MLAEARQAVVKMEEGGTIMWVGLAVSYVFLCRAPELWAYGNGQAHPEFCLTRNCIYFWHEGVQVAFENILIATALQVKFLASKLEQKRAGRTIARTRLVKEKQTWGGSVAVSVRGSVELLDVYPLLPAEAPLTVRSTPLGWKVSTRTEAVAALKCLIGSNGRDPMQFALHSGGIGGGGHPAGIARNLGVPKSARRKADVSGVYGVCEGGRGRGKLCFCCSRRIVE